MDSIIKQKDGYCYLCGQRENGDHLDEHHVFIGYNRKKSEQYGLKVKLHHNKCHIFGENAVHHNDRIMRELQAKIQKEAMEYYGWNVDDFRKIFGKSYI